MLKQLKNSTYLYKQHTNNLKTTKEQHEYNNITTLNNNLPLRANLTPAKNAQFLPKSTIFKLHARRIGTGCQKTP